MEDEIEVRRRGCAVVVQDEVEANALPHTGKIRSERLRGEIRLSGGDAIRVRWLRMNRGWSVLSIWFYCPGPDGTWLPIRDRGIRISVQHVRAFLDAVNLAAAEEAEWRQKGSALRRAHRADAAGAVPWT